MWWLLDKALALLRLAVLAMRLQVALGGWSVALKLLVVGSGILGDIDPRVWSQLGREGWIGEGFLRALAASS